MSRIGKKLVAIPGGVTANIEGDTLTVKGPKGTLTPGAKHVTPSSSLEAPVARIDR